MGYHLFAGYIAGAGRFLSLRGNYRRVPTGANEHQILSTTAIHLSETNEADVSTKSKHVRLKLVARIRYCKSPHERVYQPSSSAVVAEGYVRSDDMNLRRALRDAGVR